MAATRTRSGKKIGRASSSSARESAARQSLADLRGLDTMARIAVVREGVPASVVETLAGALGLSKEKLYAAVGLARPTVDRKIREGRILNADETERVLGVARLVEEVQRIVGESGDPGAARDFDAAAWLGRWLDARNRALDGKRPAELLDTADGRALVGDLIASMQTGAYW